MTDVTERFSSRVRDYVTYRPGYPPAILPLLQQQIGWQPGWQVADIGSGTGLSSQLFLEHGNEVFAVEPNSEMRAAAEALLRNRAGFHSIPGRAEATTLPSSGVDLVVVAQAFHWFDVAAARAEFRRILRPDGWVVLLWNTRRTEASAFMRGYETLVERFGTDYQQVRHDRMPPGRLEHFFGAAFDRATLQHEQVFDLTGLLGRLRSSSYVPAADHPDYAAMLTEMQDLFARHQQDGLVRFEYELEVYTGRLAQASISDITL